MRSFKDGDTLVIEPWRAEGLPGDQGPGRRPQRLRPDHRRPAASSRCPTGSAPDGNAIPVPKDDAELAMDAAACIGCGACVAACPNASAMLFTARQGRRTSALLPQGQPERYLPRAQDGRADGRRRASAAAPTTASARPPAPRRSRSTCIARLNRDYLKASLIGAEESQGGGGASPSPRCSRRAERRRDPQPRRRPVPPRPSVKLRTLRTNSSNAAWPRSARIIGSTARITIQGSRCSAADARSSSARFVSPSARWYGRRLVG